MDQVRVIFSDEKSPYLVPKQALNCMQYLKTLSKISHGDIQLNVRKVIFDKIIQFLALNNYQAVKTAQVTTNDLKKVLDNKQIMKFLKVFKNDSNKVCQFNLSQLFKAASYLQCKYLTDFIGFYIATVIYFEDSSQSYLKAKQKFGVKQSITLEDQQRYTRTFL